MPQYAIAQDGSSFSAASNPAIASGNSKEWSNATARVNCGLRARVARGLEPHRAELFGGGGLWVLLGRAQEEHREEQD